MSDEETRRLARDLNPAVQAARCRVGDHRQPLVMRMQRETDLSLARPDMQLRIPGGALMRLAFGPEGQKVWPLYCTACNAEVAQVEHAPVLVWLAEGL